MKIRLTVLSNDVEEQRSWFRNLEFLKGLGDGFDLNDRPGKPDEPEIFFISPDYKAPDSSSTEQYLLKQGRKNKCVILVLSEAAADLSKVGQWFKQTWVDDVVITPFRSSELISRVREAERLFLWHQVQAMNANMTGIIERLKDDLALAERIQKSRHPIKFDGLKGLTVRSRYLSGVKAGGDYFDVVESKNKSRVSFLLTDSSSYGLSSSLLGVLMKVAIKVAGEEGGSALELVRRIYSEIELTLSDKDKLSLFYGVFDRKEYTLKYVNLGGVTAFLSKPGQAFQALPKQGDAITKYAGVPVIEEGTVDLEFEDRLALVSDGFIELSGGDQGLVETLNSKRNQDVLDGLNELVYRVKTGTGDYDEMPAQDCTGLLIQFERQLIRVKN